MSGLPPPAAHLLGKKFQFTGLDAAHAVGRDAGRQLHLVAVHRGKHDGTVLSLSQACPWCRARSWDRRQGKTAART